MARRRSPLDRLGARFDQIAARLALVTRTLDRWIAAGAEPRHATNLHGIKRDAMAMAKAKARASNALRALGRAGFEPRSRSHATIQLAPGMIVAVKHEYVGMYQQIWPGEDLARLTVDMLVGKKLVVCGSKRLGVIPKAHLAHPTNIAQQDQEKENAHGTSK